MLMLYKKSPLGHPEFFTTVQNAPYIPRKKDIIVVNGEYYRVTQIAWVVGENHLSIAMEPVS